VDRADMTAFRDVTVFAPARQLSFPFGIMANVIDNMELLSRVLAAPRAIALVAVAWSPWHRRSLPILERLESSQGQWSPNYPVSFFVLWPEKDGELNRWYDELCRQEYPRFELHGHGYAPLWWLIDGRVVDCLMKPYEANLRALQMRSAKAFQSGLIEKGTFPPAE
jgi:hypothetical protein